MCCLRSLLDLCFVSKLTYSQIFMHMYMTILDLGLHVRAALLCDIVTMSLPLSQDHKTAATLEAYQCNDSCMSPLSLESTLCLNIQDTHYS